ncbi:class I SAM-dependent methyltransferase [Geomonas azotofigens]|uniref:class I SAM-dependent methyltransferase n=1 Tax=Geomonas azotofigens TaxID=2843196 RepID=UPI001C106389|nr:class I SAM-dependent methyltransferase [Geomonas azotofigens]MBU5614195.1 class I SAM-dependent methyltransferase [Geomonas azotofigens]
MNIYTEFCLPHLTNCVCGLEPLNRQRELIVPLARGRVLEVGMGTALNLPFYDRERVTCLWGLEPSPGMRRAARTNVRQSGMPVRWLDLPAGAIPLEDESVDTVLSTFTLCSIADLRGALAEMRRVLAPGGRLLFCEHGAAPDARVLHWQRRITPWWRRVAGGCRLDRPIPQLIEGSGFRVVALDARYMEGVPRLAGYTYRGWAEKG